MKKKFACRWLTIVFVCVMNMVKNLQGFATRRQNGGWCRSSARAILRDVLTFTYVLTYVSTYVWSTHRVRVSGGKCSYLFIALLNTSVLQSHPSMRLAHLSSSNLVFWVVFFFLQVDDAMTIRCRLNATRRRVKLSAHTTLNSKRFCLAVLGFWETKSRVILWDTRD